MLWCGGVCLHAAQQISIKGACTARTLSVRSSLQNMAGEELAHHVVGNESGMYKAGVAGDDAPRAVASDARHVWTRWTDKHGITHSTMNSGLRLKSILFCPREHDTQS